MGDTERFFDKDDQETGEESSGASDFDTGDTALSDANTNSHVRQTPPLPTDDDQLIGKILSGRYKILRKIGQGGMGVVYEARHERLDRKVAIKVLRKEVSGLEETLIRFEREAKASASLDHQHIVDVIDYGYSDFGAFMVMEMLEGTSLEHLIMSKGPIQTGRAVSIVRQIAKALTKAHEAGLIHRDLKSANVFLLDRDGHDHVKLLDFGISKLVDPTQQDTKLTSTGAVVGTPNYMSPEQAKGQVDLDHRVDVYSLGIILYEMLVGDVPFKGNNFLEVAYKHISKSPAPPSAFYEKLDIPPELDQIVLKCMEKEREDRYQSAYEFIDALPDPSTLPGGWTSASTIPSSPSLGTSSTLNEGPQKSRKVLYILAVITVVCVAFILGYFIQDGEPADDSSTSDERQSDASAAAQVLPDTGPTKTPQVIPQTEASTEPDADPDIATAAEAGSSKAAESEVSIRVIPFPRFSKIYLSDELIGQGEQEFRVAKSGDPARIVVKAAGYHNKVRSFTPSADQTLNVFLFPIGKTSPSQPPTKVEEKQPDETPREKTPAKVKPSGPRDIMDSPYKRRKTQP